MNEIDVQRPRTDWLRLVCWLFIVGLVTGMTGFAASHSPLFSLVWLLVPTIVGTAGVFWGMIEKDRPARPMAFVAFSLVMVTPGFFFGPVPLPILPMAIVDPTGIPGFSRMPIRTTVGIVLILTTGAVAA